MRALTGTPCIGTSAIGPKLAAASGQGCQAKVPQHQLSGLGEGEHRQMCPSPGKVQQWTKALLNWAQTSLGLHKWGNESHPHPHVSMACPVKVWWLPWQFKLLVRVQWDEKNIGNIGWFIGFPEVLRKNCSPLLLACGEISFASSHSPLQCKDMQSGEMQAGPCKIQIILLITIKKSQGLHSEALQVLLFDHSN